MHSKVACNNTKEDCNNTKEEYWKRTLPNVTKANGGTHYDAQK
jgi:hypothetical protein